MGVFALSIVSWSKITSGVKFSKAETAFSKVFIFIYRHSEQAQ